MIQFNESKIAVNIKGIDWLIMCNTIINHVNPAESPKHWKITKMQTPALVYLTLYNIMY